MGLITERHRELLHECLREALDVGAGVGRLHVLEGEGDHASGGSALADQVAVWVEATRKPRA